MLFLLLPGLYDVWKTSTSGGWEPAGWGRVLTGIVEKGDGMAKLEVYGQCPRCGGNLTVGHLCPKSMVHRSDLVKAFNRPQTKSVLDAIEHLKVSLRESDEALIEKWKDEPNLQAIITRLEAMNQELHIIIVDREKDKPELMGQVIEVSKRLTDLLLLLKAAAKEEG